jgi:hypothetical protein
MVLLVTESLIRKNGLDNPHRHGRVARPQNDPSKCLKVAEELYAHLLTEDQLHLCTLVALQRFGVLFGCVIAILRVEDFQDFGNAACAFACTQEDDHLSPR